MRDAFLQALTARAEVDRDVVLLTGDLGFGVFEKFEATFPGQYFNVGVAEQNMTGLAAGLALEGKKVVTYSIGNFPTLRCLEQIRNDVCYHDLNVTIVATGGGFSYGSLGMSHHATEDLAILRSLPGMTVVAPCSAWEAKEATDALLTNEGVGYLRLDKTAAVEAPSIEMDFSLGKARRYREGDTITLIATGGIMKNVLSAVVELEKQGVHSRVLGMHSIKPIDEEAILRAVNETGGIVTVEEHNKIGGLASAVSEVCMAKGVLPGVFKSVGLDDIYSSIVGSQEYLRTQYKMDSNAIIDVVLSALKENERK